MKETRVAVSYSSEAEIVCTETLVNFTEKKRVRTIPNILRRPRSLDTESIDRAKKNTETPTEQIETRFKTEFNEKGHLVTGSNTKQVAETTILRKNGRRRKQEIRLKDLIEAESEELDAVETFSIAGQDECDSEVSSTSQHSDDHEIPSESQQTNYHRVPSRSQFPLLRSMLQFCCDNNNNLMDIRSIVEVNREQGDTDTTDLPNGENKKMKFNDDSHPFKKDNNNPEILTEIRPQCCWICEATYKSKCYHEKRVHDFNERVFEPYVVLTCKRCTKKYCRVSDYKKHLNNHLREDEKSDASVFFF